MRNLTWCIVRSLGHAARARGLGVFAAPTLLIGSQALAQDNAASCPSRAMSNRADSLFTAEAWQHSADEYKRLLACDPRDGESAYLLGLALRQLGDYSAAASAESTAAAINPARRAAALYNLAGALAKLGEREPAMAALRQGLDAGYLATRNVATDRTLDSLRTLPAFQDLARRVFGQWYSPQASSAPLSRDDMRAGLRYVVSTIRARHPNPYRILKPAQWDEELNASLARVNEMTEASYFVELVRLMSSVGDVHSAVAPSADARVMQRAVPLLFWKFADGLFIRGTDREHSSLVGAQVLAIADAPVAELWPRLIRDFPFENEWMSADEMAFYLRFPDFLRGLGLTRDSTSVRLRLRMPDGTERGADVESARRGYSVESGDTRGLILPPGWVEAGADKQSLWLTRRAENYWLATLPDHHAVYFQFNLPRDNPAHPWHAFLDALVATVRRTRAERLIIDLRHNPGGWGPMAYDLSWRLRDVPEVNAPGHLFVLLSRITQSAGVTIATELERNAHAVFVGEPLGAHVNFYNGRWGNHVLQWLPGTGIRFRVSEVPEQHSDPLDDRRFIAPDVYVPLTWSSWVSGDDPVLATALTLDVQEAAHLLDGPGDRPLQPYFRWQRPTQYWAWGRPAGHPIP